MFFFFLNNQGWGTKSPAGSIEQKDLKLFDSGPHSYFISTKERPTLQCVSVRDEIKCVAVLWNMF